MFLSEITSKYWSFINTKPWYEPYRFRVAVCQRRDIERSLTNTLDPFVTEAELKQFGWLPPDGQLLAGCWQASAQTVYFLIEAAGFPVTPIDEPLPMDLWSAEEEL